MDCANSNVAVWNSGSSQWVCSSVVADLATTVQSLNAQLAAIASPVDQFLNTLTLSTSVPIGTILPNTGTIANRGCEFSDGNYSLYIQGFDSPYYSGGYVEVQGPIYFFAPGTPVTTAQLLARCTTGRAFMVMK